MKRIFLVGLAALPGVALADSTIDSTHKFTCAANGGWMNWKWSDAPSEGAVVTESLLSGFIYSSNLGWINLGNGTPSNGHTYSQGSDEFGVNHDGKGALTGLAYGANIGWINFDWAPGQHPDEPRIDLATGKFSGLAYGANVGWIVLDAAAGAFLETDTMQCPDTDGDGIADWWERQRAGSLTRYNAGSDSDRDGVIDRDEYAALTDPEDPASVLRIGISYSPGRTITTITFPSTAARHYRIETGTDLRNWTDSGLGIITPDPGNVTTQALTIPGSSSEVQRFFRIVVLKPLQP